MAWNEPGNQNGSSKDKDPWTGRDKKSGPPELDELIKKLQQRLSTLIRKKRGGPSGPDDHTSGPFGFSPSASSISWIILLTLIAIWFFSGFFIVQPTEQAVITQLGQFNKIQLPGLHWIPRIFQNYQNVNVTQIYTYTFPQDNNVDMLTNDENIVSVAVTVWYRVDQPKDFLFNSQDPVESIQQATASATREIMGLYTLDDILTTKREEIRSKIDTSLKNIIAKYHSGIAITNVAIQSAKAPEQVKEAFDDAIKAREDQKRFENQALAYQAQEIAIADGEAQKTVEIANAYAQQVVLDATTNTAAYLALLPLYQASPQVMRERLYFDTMEQVMKNSSKILVDGSNNNVFYLPLDKLINPSNSISKPTGALPSLSLTGANPADVPASTGGSVTANANSSMASPNTSRASNDPVNPSINDRPARGLSNNYSSSNSANLNNEGGNAP